MDLKLYVIPGSHPCATVEAALDLKGLTYERVDLLPGLSSPLQLARFGRRTVPGLVVDGYKVSGSRLILRTLDGLKAEPAAVPGRPRGRRGRPLGRRRAPDSGPVDDRLRAHEEA